MLYVLTTFFIVLLVTKLLDIQSSTNLEKMNTETLVIVVYGIIIFWCILGMINIIGGHRVLNVKENKSVHVSGAFGRGKTYRVMNSSFSQLVGENLGDNIDIQNRIRNSKNLETEYHKKQLKKDVLYFSALGKTQNELLSDINYETSYGLHRLFTRLLLSFKLQKINASNLFDSLEQRRKNNYIDIIIIDDLERMSDMHYDMEINKIIRLILQLQKLYNVVIITSLDTKSNTLIKNMYENSKDTKNDAEIEEFSNMNFMMKFAKIRFDNFIYMPDNIDIVYAIREKYIIEIDDLVDTLVSDVGKYPNIRDSYYDEKTELLVYYQILGDYRSIDLCYNTIIKLLKSMKIEDLVIVIAYKFDDLIHLHFNNLGLENKMIDNNGSTTKIINSARNYHQDSNNFTSKSFMNLEQQFDLSRKVKVRKEVNDFLKELDIQKGNNI